MIADSISQSTDGAHTVKPCINLREHFGWRYQITYDLAYFAEHGPQPRVDDPWLQVLVCRYGEIFPVGDNRLAASAGLLYQLNQNNLTMIGITFVFWWYGNVVDNTFVVRDDEGHRAFTVKTSHYLMCVAFQNLNNGTFSPTSTINTGHMGDDAITMDKSTHFTGRQKQVVTIIIGNQETKSIGVCHHISPW